jgi:protein-S-isoprenylcysteine O-methyltransferase Ste14
MEKRKTGNSTYQQVRLNLSRLFVVLLIVLVAITGSQWETRAPLVSAILFLAGCLLAGIASLGRLWCSLYIAGHKTRHLVTEGPYSLCRHPLYFFSFLGGIGVGLASETLTVPVLILAAFAIYYPYVIRFEENKMTAQHGEIYGAYCRQTPRFWPRWFLLIEPEEYSVYPKTFRKHLFSALGFIWMIGVFELIEMFRELGMLPTFVVLF